MTNKMKYVLSPCGTSLLTNQADKNLRGLVSRYANKKNRDEIAEPDLAKLEGLISRVAALLKSADNELAIRMSAELNGIIKIYHGKIGKSSDFHFLLSTDTWLGEETAKLVKSWLDKHDLITIIHRQTDLQTSEITSFQLSLSELVKKLSEEIPEYSRKGYKIIFNLTGGFKSVQGFLQSIANFYADETIYIFETSAELLRIPKLPVRMDTSALIKEQISVFRQLSLGIECQVDGLKEIPETLLFKIDDQTVLSPWGEVVWEQSKAEIYKAGLLPSPSSKIEYSNAFKQNVSSLDPDRVFLVNKRIDQLVIFFENGTNPKSLDFKPLKGGGRGCSTHEIDAWSDKDAKRIFGHYNDGIYVFDILDKGLH